jgi:hypothetical protein
MTNGHETETEPPGSVDKDRIHEAIDAQFWSPKVLVARHDKRE